MLRGYIVVFCLGLWCCPPSAYGDAARGAQFYKEGVASYKAGDFEQAAQAFTSAYEADPAPLLLYNMGQSYWRLGRYEAAIDAYERYLSSEPNSDRRITLEQRIREMRAALARESAEPEPAPLPQQPVPAADQVDNDQADNDQVDNEQVDKQPAEAEPEPKLPARWAEADAADRARSRNQATRTRLMLYLGHAVQASTTAGGGILGLTELESEGFATVGIALEVPVGPFLSLGLGLQYFGFTAKFDDLFLGAKYEGRLLDPHIASKLRIPIQAGDVLIEPFVGGQVGIDVVELEFVADFAHDSDSESKAFVGLGADAGLLFVISQSFGLGARVSYRHWPSWLHMDAVLIQLDLAFLL